MIRRLALAAACCIALAGPALAQPHVWVVHGKDCDITLFGSIHVLPKDVDWEPPALKAALAQADELWFEVPVDGSLQAQAVKEAQAHALLPAGQSLIKLLSPDGQKRLADFSVQSKFPLFALDRMQPWYVDLIVSATAYGDAQQMDGVEGVLAQAAPNAKRQAFETVSGQIDIIADAPIKAQLASLESTLKDADKGKDEYQKLIDAWLKGDDATLYQHDVLTLRKDSPDLFRALITDRNAAWTRTLAERLKGKGHVMVVVGAGHLIGPDGVPARLRALGFSVDGPSE